MKTKTSGNFLMRVERMLHVLLAAEFLFHLSVFCLSGVSLVTCLEVAEHFENPVAGFKSISLSLSHDGYVAVGTLPIPCGQDFLLWWYKEDPTHVTFYTPKAINAAAAAAGLQCAGKLTERIFLYRKRF